MSLDESLEDYGQAARRFVTEGQKHFDLRSRLLRPARRRVGLRARHRRRE
jgi:hypothetical protein